MKQGRLYTYRGKGMTLAELAATAKVPKEILSYRLNRLRWPVADAVETPKLTPSQAGQRGADAAARQHLISPRTGKEGR